MPFFLVNKPSWYTSHDIVDKFKFFYYWEKVGHSGTLDPMATGLLIIAVWRDSTKHLWKLLWMDKTYITEIDFSIFTDTWDMDFYDTMEKYNIIFKSGLEKKEFLSQKKLSNSKVYDYYNLYIPKSRPDLNQIKQKLDSLIPEAELPLTMFSAKKKDGKKLYEFARQWIDLNLKQKMKVNSYEILEYSFPKLKLRLNVGSWTYIRSIGYWLGQQFWLWGTLTMLHRESIGPFRLNK